MKLKKESEDFEELIKEEEEEKCPKKRLKFFLHRMQK